MGTAIRKKQNHLLYFILTQFLFFVCFIFFFSIPKHFFSPPFVAWFFWLYRCYRLVNESPFWCKHVIILLFFVMSLQSKHLSFCMWCLKQTDKIFFSLKKKNDIRYSFQFQLTTQPFLYDSWTKLTTKKIINSSSTPPSSLLSLPPSLHDIVSILVKKKFHQNNFHLKWPHRFLFMFDVE